MSCIFAIILYMYFSRDKANINGPKILNTHNYKKIKYHYSVAYTKIREV